MKISTKASNRSKPYILFGENMDRLVYVDLDIIKLLCWAYDEEHDSYPESPFEGAAVYEWIQECVLDMVEV